jgi:2-isopropylmalate synthase
VATAEGNGPVNALDKALRVAVGRFYPELDDIELIDFKVRVLEQSKGTGAVTRVLIETSNGDREWGTIGVSENIIEASWEALADSVDFGLTHSPGAGAGTGAKPTSGAARKASRPKPSAGKSASAS